MANYSTEYPKLIKKDLDPYITCPLCKGYFRDAHTAIECSHTFCKSCIYKYYYDHYTSELCPICDTKLGGIPANHIIADTNKQMLVDTLYPFLREQDEVEKEKLKAFLGIGIGKKEGEIKEKLENCQYPSVELILKPNLTPIDERQKLPPLPCSMICVPKRITVYHLKKYLLRRLARTIKGLPNEKPECIMYENSPLPPEHCLLYIMKEIARTDLVLTLNYQLHKDFIGSLSTGEQIGKSNET